MNKITDPEILAFIAKTQAYYPDEANLASAQENRDFYNRMCAAFQAPRPQTIKVDDDVFDGVAVRCYDPMSDNKSQSQILYLHGGGFVVGSLDSHDDICNEIAAATQIAVTAVDYRLMPEHVTPAQLDDVEKVWNILTQKGKDEIILVGDSAGGNLCAGLCIRLAAKKSPMPIRQILIYPSLGGDLSLPSYSQNADAPLLRTIDLLAYRNMQKDLQLSQQQSYEAAPLSVRDFAIFPPTVIFTADIDPLRDDGTEFFHALEKANVKVQLYNGEQLVHGYLRGRHMSQRIARSFNAICHAIGHINS